MAVELTDDIFARHLLQSALARQTDIDSARALQAEKSAKNTPITIGAALVELNVIHQQQREDIERLLLTRLQGISSLGKYKIINKLGEGGMGAVYLAQDTTNNKKVAIKVLPRQFAEDPNYLTRFKREALATSSLKHPNIVTALEVGEDVGHHYYVMEYFDGQALNTIMDREKVLPCMKALNIVEQVALGLHFAHAKGVVHRDIKPANIYLTNDGRVKILDLGLHKNITEAERAFHTQSGMVIGTPHFIAPEQVDRGKTVDARTDIYSLGATFYLLITGETPFWGDTASVIMAQHLKGQLPNPQALRKGLPEGVMHIIIKMMAKKPEDRYQNCEELINDIIQVKSDRRPSSRALDPRLSSVAQFDRREGELTSFKSYTRRSQPARIMIIVVALALGYLLVLIGILIFKGSQP